MILTVSLSPCIDVNIEVDSLSVGMTNRIINKRTFFTGKTINVAIGLSRLGAAVFTTGFMFTENGSLFEQELYRERVPYEFVWNEGRVRENYKFVDHRSMLTEIEDAPFEISKEKQEELIARVKELSSDCKAVVVAGSLARGMTADYYGGILSVVPDNVIKVVDSEGDRLLASLKYGVDLVKPNLDELQRTLNIKITNKTEAIAACRALIDLGAKRVLLSLGKHGAIITDGVKSYYCKSLNVAMNSTIGAGDAMVAAATRALVNGEDLQSILRCGVAAGTAAVTLPDYISFTREKYDEIFSSLCVREI